MDGKKKQFGVFNRNKVVSVSMCALVSEGEILRRETRYILISFVKRGIFSSLNPQNNVYLSSNIYWTYVLFCIYAWRDCCQTYSMRTLLSINILLSILPNPLFLSDISRLKSNPGFISVWLLFGLTQCHWPPVLQESKSPSKRLTLGC